MIPGSTTAHTTSDNIAKTKNIHMTIYVNTANGLTGAKTSAVGTNKRMPGIDTRATDLTSFFHITGLIILP